MEYQINSYAVYNKKLNKIEGTEYRFNIGAYEMADFKSKEEAELNAKAMILWFSLTPKEKRHYRIEAGALDMDSALYAYQVTNSNPL